jgi:nucleoside-diphosphate-sugar epimerase
MRYALAIDRARRELGWEPRVLLEDGLAACVAAAYPR